MNEATAKQRAAVWVAVVFLLGAALGGVVGYIFAHRAVSANIMMTVSQRRAQNGMWTYTPNGSAAGD